MKQRTRSRKTERTGVHALFDQRAHRRHVAGRRRLALDAALAHHEDAHRRMRHLRREIDVAAPGRQGVEIVGEALPVPRHAFAHHQLGNVLDAFHDLHQRVAVGGPAGREADAAVAHQHRRHAMAGGGREPLVPGRLPVIVGVDVDEARCHREPLGVDLLAAGAWDAADGGDLAILHRDIGRARFAAGPVKHGAVAHHQIELGRHGLLLRESVAQGCGRFVSSLTGQREYAPPCQVAAAGRCARLRCHGRLAHAPRKHAAISEMGLLDLYAASV